MAIYCRRSEAAKWKQPNAFEYAFGIIDTFSKQLEKMNLTDMELTSQAFGHAKDAITVLQFYYTIEGPSNAYEEQKQNVIARLLQHAKSQPQDSEGADILISLAAALEK